MGKFYIAREEASYRLGISLREVDKLIQRGFLDILMCPKDQVDSDDDPSPFVMVKLEDVHRLTMVDIEENLGKVNRQQQQAKQLKEAELIHILTCKKELLVKKKAHEQYEWQQLLEEEAHLELCQVDPIDD